MDVSGDCSKEQSLALYEMLSVDRRNKVDRLRNADMKEKQIKIGAFLQYILSTYLNIVPECVEFEYNPQGKPSVKQSGSTKNEMELYFNMSHSGDYVVLAVGDAPLGIDVERKRSDRLKVAKRCFCKEEYEYIISAINDEEQVERFLEYWTLKEAFVKYIGKGLAVPLNSFLIKREASNYRLILLAEASIYGDALDVGNISLESFELCAGYRISICHNNIESVQNVKKISLFDLLDL